MTGPGKNISRRIAVAGIAASLLLAALLLVPRLVGLDAVRSRIETAVAERTGATVRYREAEVHVFPRPRIVIRGAKVAFPGMAEGNIGAVTVIPTLLPLLKGKFLPAGIQVEKPVFRVRLAEASRRVRKRIESLSPERIREETRRLLAAWGSAAPGLAVSVERGELILSREGEEPVSFRDVRAQVSSPPGTLRLLLSCSGSLWDGIDAEGNLDAGDLHGAVTVSLKNFRPGALVASWFPETGIGVAGTVRDLVLNLRTEGMRTFEGDAKGIAPSLTMRRGNHAFELKGMRAGGSVRADAGHVEVSLSGLGLDAPRIALSGKLSVDRTSRNADLSLLGREADVRSVRTAALALAGDLPAVRDLFSVIEAGRVPFVSIEGHGRTPADLGRLGNLRIRGEIREGELHVPRPDLRLQGVSGEAVVEKGILTGSNASARLGRSRGTEGELTLGLVGKDRPFRMRARVAADLSELPPLLENLVPDGPFREELSLLREVEGSADGVLTLGNATGPVRTRVDVTSFALSCRYLRVPFPLTLRGGTFHYDEGEIRGEDLAGTAGGSSFSGVGGRVRLPGTPYLESLSGNARIDAAGIFPWLSSFERVRKAFEGIGYVRGTIAVSLARMEGPAADPEGWRFDASGGSEDLRAAFLDSTWTASGKFEGTADGLRSVEGSARGNAGPEAVRRISGLLRIPPGLRPRAPLVLSGSSFSWKQGGGTSFRGDFDFSGGPAASVDLRKDRDTLKIRKLDLRDGASHASLSLEPRGGALLLEFSGTVRGETLDKVLADNAWCCGSLEGDFRARIVPGDLGRSTAAGRLEGRNIAVPWKRTVPLTLVSVSLTAGGHGVRVHPSVFALGGHGFTVKGDLVPSGDLWLIDTDVSSDEVDWDRLKDLFAEVREGPGTGRLYDLPVRGKIRLRAPSLTYGGRRWAPFHAEISLAPSRIDIRVLDAALCGISFPGSLSVTPRDLSIAFRPARKGGDFSQTISCLGEKEVGITGSFDLEGEFTGGGGGEALAGSLDGKVALTAKKGRVDRMTLLAKVFALLNVTEIFRGKIPDLVKQGFPYETANLKGNVRGGKLFLTEAAIEGPSLEIFGHGDVDLVSGRANLELLVAPFRTVDSIIRVIPLLRYVMGGTLVSIPVKVSGNIADPDVTPFSPTAVGSDILGLIGRTLKVPVRILQPLLPEGKGK